MASSRPPGLWVFLGGALGAVGRAWVETVVPDAAGGFPATTLAINLSGSFALGLLVRTLALRGPDQRTLRAVRLGLGTGVLGGFTTFSAFAVQTVTLVQQDRWGVAVSYLVLSCAGGFAAAWAGTGLAHRLGGRP